MKKSALLLCLAMILPCLFLFVSCGGDGEDAATTAETTAGATSAKGYGFAPCTPESARTAF